MFSMMLFSSKHEKGDIIVIPPGYGHVNPTPGQTLAFGQSGINSVFQRL
jgi:oxalate decarboxylase/phosphoglucose isomerase-like protein (cupin superfamily)